MAGSMTNFSTSQGRWKPAPMTSRAADQGGNHLIKYTNAPFGSKSKNIKSRMLPSLVNTSHQMSPRETDITAINVSSDISSARGPARAQ